MCSNWFWSGILSLSLRHLNEIRVLPFPALVHFKPWSCQLGSTRQTNFVSPLNYNIIIQPKLITKHIDWHLFLAVLGKCMQAFYVYIWRGFLYWSLHLLLNDFSLGKSKWPSAVCLSKHDSHSRLSCSGGLKKISFFPWNTYLQEKWDKSVVVENQVCVFAMETAFIRNTVMGGISISTIASVQLLQHAGAASCRLLLTQPGRSISFINLVIMGCFWLQRLRWSTYSLLYSGNTRD